ncbi:Cold shock protein CspB (Major cold shock protein) [Durusdinium trenchii]|uniref:Cold shock protein CspB (Major cold shock protein) n=1 Tax=Durusdinium trenchii TaxID=1381693 RepID=A0ABP0HCZ6_9DINO
MLTGTIKSYNPHKGWGFIECNGQDTFVNKKDLKGHCPSKGHQVKFEISQTEKGAQATNVEVLVSDEEKAYFGEIKSFNPSKGYGFISCEAFPDKDIFVLKSELPGGFGPQGGLCKFKVSHEDKGPSAKEVTLLGSAGNQVQQMKAMGYGYYGKGDWGSSGGWGKGWGGKGDSWGGKGWGGYDMSWGVPMQMPIPWGKGYGKSYGRFATPERWRFMSPQPCQAPARPRQPAERSGAPAPPLHARDLLARVPPAAAAELRDPEESRRRLQAVLLTASRNGVWESVLQAVFKSPTCACGDGHCSEHREHHEACEHCLPQDEVARSKQEKQRGQREGRGELEAAKASGGGADLVDPELNVLGPEKSRSVRSLKAEIRVITQERQELHREVERLRQQLHRPDHGPT